MQCNALCRTVHNKWMFFSSLGIAFVSWQRLVTPKFTQHSLHQQYSKVAGGTLFGGLLDRCTVSPLAEVFKKYTPNSLDGTSYFLNVTNLKRSDLNTDILSYPVQECFCRQGQPDCSYEPHTEYAKKGQPFKVPLVAVDQVKKHNSI